MTQDPKGYQGIPWGAPLSTRPDMTEIETADRTQGYERKATPIEIGGTPVEWIRYVQIDGQFARVAIRYQGKTSHDAVLKYLQSHFGQMDHTPGQMMRGLNQQYYWKGSDTQINLTYDGRSERGTVFFESLTLAP